ncbi:ATP-binding protein [Dongia sp.]|uniref:ATP-binding protein n=1 Tax=Dongia sp. TaxID=1977262 RepID=UPI0035B4629C
MTFAAISDPESEFSTSQLAEPFRGGWLTGYFARDWRLRWIGGNLLAALFYFLLGLAVGKYFSAYGLFPAPIWLPASVAIVAAMLGGWRMLPGLFLGSFLINYGFFESSFTVAAIISATNALGPVLSAALIRRLQPAGGIFSRFSGVVIFIAGAVVLHPAITATGGTLALNLGGFDDMTALFKTWTGWWLCDSGGTLSFAPCLLLWLRRENVSESPVRPLTRIDSIVWLTVAIVVVGLFAIPPAPISLFATLPFLLVVPLSWIALKTSLRAAYTLVSLASVIAMAGTAAGVGPFHAPASINPLQMAGELIVLLTMTTLTIVALFRERRAAEEANRGKSMLLATASHDLRTPLNAIIGFADLMRGDHAGQIDPARYRDYAGHIHSSGSLLLGMVNEILDHAKIEAGKREINPAWLDARAIADACVQIVAGRAAEKRLRVALSAAPSALLYADELALRQVLLNLLSNAIKFTNHDGKVDVRLFPGAERGMILEVSDNGIGMDEDELSRALQPFVQAGTDRHRAAESGTGLGLAIVYRLAEMHGASFSISSAPNRGTTVRIGFPAGHSAHS